MATAADQNTMARFMKAFMLECFGNAMGDVEYVVVVAGGAVEVEIGAGVVVVGVVVVEVVLDRGGARWWCLCWVCYVDETPLALRSHVGLRRTLVCVSSSLASRFATRQWVGA